MELNNIEPIIEALLFTSGDPLSLERIAEVIETDKKTARLIMNNLILNYNEKERGIMIREINNAYQLCTRPEYFQYISKLFEPRHKQALSQAAYETLAIVAYKQPVTRAKIEQIRGVNSDSAINRLLEKNLIKEGGRMDAPGKPIYYVTTDEFLRSFGFKSLLDLPLPAINDLKELNEEEAYE